MDTAAKALKYVVYSLAIISFLALFISLSALNGWFFYDLGVQIPLSQGYTMAIPFAVMGIAISFTASILSVTAGRLALIVGFGFHLVSIGVTYSSLNFALNKQGLESDKVSQLIAIEKNKQQLKNELIKSAKSGDVNTDQITLMQERDSKIEALKRTQALNSEGKKVGTVWDKTAGCTAKNWYAKTYAGVCSDIENVAANYAAKISGAAKVQENISGLQNSLDKQADLVFKQSTKVELPRLFADESFNKQAVILIVAVLFDVALVMLEWLLSGKIGRKTGEKQAANSRQFSRILAEREKVSAGAVSESILSARNSVAFWKLFRDKSKQAKRAEELRKQAEREAKEARMQLSSMRVMEGLEAMRNMTGFHILRVFRENNVSLDTESASVIALICRTYEMGGNLSRDRIYELVNALPECSDIKIGRDKLERSIKLMAGVIAEEYQRGSKQTAYKWANQAEVFGVIGSVRVA